MTKTKNKKKNKQRLIAQILAFLLVISMLVPMIASIGSYASADTHEHIHVEETNKNE